MYNNIFLTKKSNKMKNVFKLNLIYFTKLVSTTIISIFIIGCNGCKKNIKEWNLEIDPNEFISMNDLNDTLFAKGGIGVTKKGATWKSWNNYFKDCIQNFDFQRAEFAGYSSSFKVGDLRTKKGLTSYSLVEIIGKQEYDKIISIGNTMNGECISSKFVDKGISTELAISLMQYGNANLKIASNLIDSSRIELGGVRVEHIANLDLLKDLINTDPRLNKYKDALQKEKRLLIYQALRVGNSAFYIKLKGSNNDSLIAGLPNGGIGDFTAGDISINFKKISNKEIICTINSPYYVFMQLVRVKN